MIEQAFSEAPKPRLHRIPLPVRVVVVEEDPNVFVQRYGNVLGEEVTDPAGAVSLSPGRVRVRAEAMDEDNAFRLG